jgi:hypothetical protein
VVAGTQFERKAAVRISVLEAIRDGLWDFEPCELERGQYAATKAMPGTREKLDVLALRAAQGLPLWHSDDRVEYDDGFDRPLPR